MKIDVKVPAVGESVTEATIGSWNKKSGEFVKRNDVLLLLETDKASVEVVAENDGVLTIAVEAGQTIKIGSVVATLDTDGKASASAAPAAPTTTASATTASLSAAPSPQASAPANTHLSPAVQKIVTERNIDTSAVNGTGKDGRLTKGDVLGAPAGGMTTTAAAKPAAPAPKPAPPPIFASGPRTAGAQEKKLVPMTNIRKRIAERLLESQQTTATLTTFNEIDMSKVNELRAKYKDKFKEKYGISLGFMGLFTKASIEALKAFPLVNSYIVGDQVEYHNYFNIGMAVSTEKGLMVPVIKNAESLTVPQIEMAIRDFALKARDGKITVDDLNGGTFSITNGGVFGSLLSTPILNPPQSAILGMHKTEDRAVVINGKIEVRPMMYVALSYDHRVIDGKEAVGFLVKIKEGIEDPERLLIEI
jgi:2-oxoglutarate dehydrogenase E2 component (dihydrolipoamide succinyltransferase)